MKAAEIRDLGIDELRAQEKDLDDQLFRLRIQKSMGQLEAPLKVRTMRRDLARLLPDGKTMVVSAAWPGATVEETLKQVTERLERTLQETPHLDFLRSFTRAGVTTIFVNLKGSTTAQQVPDVWYNVRKSIGDMRHTLPAGVIGPAFNDDFGDTFGIIYGFTADGFTHRELRDCVEKVRSELLHVADVSKIEILGAQDERIFVEFSTKDLANLGLDRAGVVVDDRGYIVVDEALATNVPGIWALGDCNGRGAFTQTSYNDYEIVAANLLDHENRRVSDRIPAYALYVDPPLGRVGLSETEAVRTGRVVPQRVV